MTTYVLRRLMLMLPVAFLVTVGVFMLIHLTPGDPALVLLGEDRSPQAIADIHKQLGLDKPIYIQYGIWLDRMAHGDFGRSITTHQPVSTAITERLPATLELGIVALLWSLIVAIALGTAGAAINMRFTRSSMIEVLNNDYVRTAWAKGASWRRVVFIHALKNALIPVVTIVGLQIGGIIEGAVVTETVFTWPGVGRLAVESISDRDYTVVQGIVLLAAFSYMVANLLVDLVYRWIDPRISYA